MNERDDDLLDWTKAAARRARVAQGVMATGAVLLVCIALALLVLWAVSDDGAQRDCEARGGRVVEVRGTGRLWMTGWVCQ